MVKQRYSAIYIILVLMMSAHLSGCQKVLKVFIKPPPEGIEERSYTIRLMGYEQTVTIRATLEELSEFLNDPSRSSGIMQSSLTIKGEDVNPDEFEPTRTGTAFPINVKVMGFGIPGTLIVVKIEAYTTLWVVWDNPYAFQVQRWKSTPVEEGTDLTFKFDTEIPTKGFFGNMVNALGFMGLADAALKDVDMMMASIQANFDPSLDPEQLVSFGLRGEPYEAVLQAHEAQIWVNAPPDHVHNWIIDPENVAGYLQELKMDKDAIRKFQQATPGEVVYSRVSLHAGAIRTKSDFFAVKKKKGKENIIRLYYTLFSDVGFMEFNTKPEAGGTLVTCRIAFEIPELASGQGMEVILFATGLPELLRERVMMIKQGVEATG